VTILFRKSEGIKGLLNRKFTETIRWVPLKCDVSRYIFLPEYPIPKIGPHEGARAVRKVCAIKT